jgi:hypothetical protein
MTTRSQQGRQRDAERQGSSEPEQNGRLGPLELLELGPTLARMGTLASLRAARWATSSSLAGWRRIAVAIRDRESPGALLASARDEAVLAARDVLGVTELDRRLARLTSDSASSRNGAVDADLLRHRGRELLARSARLEPEPDAHPAYGLMLEALAPDEARILRALARLGPQPTIDVVETGPLGIGRGRPIASRISILDELAGCRDPDRLELYLDNLVGLGLVRIDDDPLDEEPAYDLLEALPTVSDAKERAGDGAGRAKVVRHRIDLSGLGRHFCECCLPVEER